MAVLHKLQTGLDVNVKFTGVRVFEYTPECIVFDLLDIPLYHGWLVDPQVRSFSDTHISNHIGWNIPPSPSSDQTSLIFLIL